MPLRFYDYIERHLIVYPRVLANCCQRKLFYSIILSRVFIKSEPNKLYEGLFSVANNKNM